MSMEGGREFEESTEIPERAERRESTAKPERRCTWCGGYFLSVDVSHGGEHAWCYAERLRLEAATRARDE